MREGEVAELRGCLAAQLRLFLVLWGVIALLLLALAFVSSRPLDGAAWAQLLLGPAGLLGVAFVLFNLLFLVPVAALWIFERLYVKAMVLLGRSPPGLAPGGTAWIRRSATERNYAIELGPDSLRLRSWEAPLRPRRFLGLFLLGAGATCVWLLRDALGFGASARVSSHVGVVVFLAVLALGFFVLGFLYARPSGRIELLLEAHGDLRLSIPTLLSGTRVETYARESVGGFELTHEVLSLRLQDGARVGEIPLGGWDGDQIVADVHELDAHLQRLLRGDETSSKD